jgi:hypothetical protein
MQIFRGDEKDLRTTFAGSNYVKESNSFKLQRFFSENKDHYCCKTYAKITPQGSHDICLTGQNCENRYRRR